jgi:hypothetical protein
LTVLTTGSAQAQATRTWVSGVGDDANPCSRTAPCKTFAGAISKTAPSGEIDALDPGGFGGVTITKAITIDGGGGQVASVLVSGTNGITVVAGSSDVVTLRNLRFQGVGSGTNGISVSSVGVLHIENCSISNFTGNGINIAEGLVFVTGSSVRDNGTAGLNVAGGVVSITDSKFNYNNSGVVANGNSAVAIRNSEASGNTAVGFSAAGSSGQAVIDLTNSSATNNNVGIQAAGAAAFVRMAGVSVYNNSTGLAVSAGGTIQSFGNNYNTDTGTPGGLIAPQ